MDGQSDVTAWAGLKDPGLAAKEFTANGKVYTIAESVSIDRWEMYEDLQVEVGLPRSFEQIQADAVRGYDLCNRMAQKEHHLADIAIIFRDLATGCALQQSRAAHPVLKLCALFMNYKGEDTRFITEEVIAEKVNDWRAAGIAMPYFFRFALHSIPGFVAAYRASSPGTSERTGGGQTNQSGKTGSQGTNKGSPGHTPAPSSNA